MKVEYWTVAAYDCPGPSDSLGAAVLERELEVVYTLRNKTHWYLVYEAKSKEEKVKLRYVVVTVQTHTKQEVLALKPGDIKEVQVPS